MERNIGLKLKELRKMNGYTQAQISEYLGIDQSNLSKIERNQRKLNMSIVDKLCLLYGCSTEYLTGESDEYNPPNIAFRTSKVDLNAIAKINEIREYLSLLK